MEEPWRLRSTDADGIYETIYEPESALLINCLRPYQEDYAQRAKARQYFRRLLENSGLIAPDDELELTDFEDAIDPEDPELSEPIQPYDEDNRGYHSIYGRIITASGEAGADVCWNFDLPSFSPDIGRLAKVIRAVRRKLPGYMDKPADPLTEVTIIIEPFQEI